MTETKSEFYKRMAADTSVPDNPEAEIRYSNAVDWLAQEDGLVIGEVGCNYAKMISALKRRDLKFNYHGVDLDGDVIAKASRLEEVEKFENISLSQANVEDGFPFEAGSLDVFVAFEILEHLEDASRALGDAKKCLRPGGKIIISVPNPYYWEEMYMNYRNRPDVEGHIASFTYGNIDALLYFTGLKLVDRMGTYCRIPFSKRVTGKKVIVKSNAFFLTRSFMFLLEIRE